MTFKDGYATSMAKLSGLYVILCVSVIHDASGKTCHHKFVVESSSYTRLCSTKKILTVNGEFPGPTLTAHRGDKLIVKVFNKANHNITIHWHGVRQPRNPWSDGPEYITQCPIQPGNNFTYVVHLTREEGTIWWHAHSGWARATVHGAFIIYPKHGSSYPFPKPFAEIPIILGEWWKKDVMEIPGNANKTGGEPILSDAYTINGQPGYLHACSKNVTFNTVVEFGRTYLLRILSAVIDENMFFGIAKHKLTVVGKDGLYLKQMKTDYIMIAPGQSMDVLFEANQPPNHYAIAARAYADAVGSGFDKTTAAGFIVYKGSYNPPPSPFFPHLPPYNRTRASTDFTKQFRSLASKNHPIKAYYYAIPGVFQLDFPRKPPRVFNYTGDNLPENLLTPSFGTKVLALEYNANVELVLQGTNVLASDNHPIHLHGYSFYVVGWGFGSFDPKNDTLNYNLIDPPEETTVGVPKNGWVAIRFKADNPGLWLMHCHIERHQTWGMDMVFLVRNGSAPHAQLLRPPHDLPKC